MADEKIECNIFQPKQREDKEKKCIFTYQEWNEDTSSKSYLADIGGVYNSSNTPEVPSGVSIGSRGPKFPRTSDTKSIYKLIDQLMDYYKQEDDDFLTGLIRVLIFYDVFWTASAMHCSYTWRCFIVARYVIKKHPDKFKISYYDDSIVDGMTGKPALVIASTSGIFKFNKDDYNILDAWIPVPEVIPTYSAQSISDATRSAIKEFSTTNRKWVALFKDDTDVLNDDLENLIPSYVKTIVDNLISSKRGTFHELVSSLLHLNADKPTYEKCHELRYMWSIAEKEYIGELVEDGRPLESLLTYIKYRVPSDQGGDKLIRYPSESSTINNGEIVTLKNAPDIDDLSSVHSSMVSIDSSWTAMKAALWIEWLSVNESVHKPSDSEESVDPGLDLPSKSEAIIYLPQVNDWTGIIPTTSDLSSTKPCFKTSALPDVSYISLPVIPESISDSTSAEWQTSQIIGRNSPLAAYITTGARQCDFSFTMSLDPEEDTESGSIDYILRSLRTTVYSRALSSAGVIPPITTFRIYNFISTGYVTSVKYNWKPPILTINGVQVFSLVEVSISMIEIAEGNPNVSSMMNKNSAAPFNTSIFSLFGGS